MEMNTHILIGTLLLVLSMPMEMTAQSANDTSYPSVDSVYLRLKEAIGDKSRTPPQLKVVNRKKDVASYYSGERNTIELEVPAIKICLSLGKDSLNSLAFLLGHELGHFYRNHSFLKEAASSYAGMDIGEKLAAAKVAIDTTIKCETEADEFACYYSQMAGFSISAADTLIRAIYRGYKLRDSISLYPTLNERCGIANEVQNRMKDLHKVFNLANLMMMGNDCETAEILYQYILNQNFGSREVKNNLGVCMAMQGLRFTSDRLKNVVFPFMLDPFSRAAEGVRSILTEDSLKAVDYFKQAEIYFSDAATLDKKYYPAQINMAVIKALMGKPKPAFRMLDQIEDEFSDVKEAMKDCGYTRALLAYLTNQSKAELQALAQTGDIRATTSLQRIMQTEIYTQDQYKLPTSSITAQLQPSIRKSSFNSTQLKRIRLSGPKNVDIWSRDSLGMQLIVLNVVKPYNKSYQIIQCNSKQIWPEGIPDALYNTEPDAEFHFGNLTLEKRRSEKMTFYFMQREGKEEGSWVVY
jgi:tetratricopeptide (TPR) repeat protein